MIVVKKYIGYVITIVGFLCIFLIGFLGDISRPSGSMGRLQVEDYIGLLIFYIITPVIGFFLMKLGIKLVNSADEKKDNDID